MPVRAFGELTWEEARELAGSEAVALLPVGAIEAHGPHLPLETDVIIATAIARAAADRLAAHGLEVLLLPPLPYTPAPFAAGFPGTLGVHPEVLRRLLVDLAGSLARHGFPVLGIANAHLDPTHIGALRQAAREILDEGRVAVAFPDLTRRALARRLTEEFRSGACHAGRFETSIVLAERPDLVREERRSGLPPVPASLSEAIADGKRTFEEAGGERAYFGWPADATAEEGRRTVALLGEILAEAVGEALRGGSAMGGSATGDPAQGDLAPGGSAQGDPAPGDPAQGNPAPGDPAPGDPAQGDPAPGDPAPGGSTPGGAAPGGAPPSRP